MDAKKITEALDRELQSHIDRMRQAIAELDKPAEPVAWMWKQLMHGYMGGWHFKCETYNPLNNIHVRPEDIEALTPLYTHPPQAAGLTVDEAEDCLVEHLAQYGPDWSATARSRLRARLTAAIEAKQHLNR